MNEILFPTASYFPPITGSGRLHVLCHVAFPATEEPVGFSLETLLAALPTLLP